MHGAFGSAAHANLFLGRFKEPGQFGTRLRRGARMVPQVHPLNAAELGEQLFDNNLKHKTTGRMTTMRTTLLADGSRSADGAVPPSSTGAR